MTERPQHIKSVLITCQASAISVVTNTGCTYTFDHAGRPVSLFINERYFARSLSGEFKEKSWKGAKDEFDRIIRVVPEEEKNALLEKLRHDLCFSIEAIDRSTAVCEVRGNLSQGKALQSSVSILKFLLEKLKTLSDEEARFQKLYQPVAILPPDHYFTIVLQVVEGCPWNRCTFCDFYKSRPFRIKPLDELRRHLVEVAHFFGAGSTLRNSVFLADANAFVMRNDQLLEILQETSRRFPYQIETIDGGVATFADVPAILRKRDSDLERLRAAGLKNLCIGIETGSENLRETVRKAGTPEDIRRAVQRLKRAGFTVELISMLGLGGERWALDHVSTTLELLNSLPLDSRDILFFSPYYPEGETPYCQMARAEHWIPVDQNGMRQQYASFKKSLFPRRNTSPRVAVYDIREFVY